MLDIILNENEINFNELEKNFFKAGCELACLEFKKLLESLDEMLMKEREKNIYRHKGYKQTTIKTLMGEVTFRRAIYEVIDEENNEVRYVYLLDKAIGFETIGLVSTNLAQKIVDSVAVSSYRESAKNVSELCGQSISHGGVWNVVKGLGEKLKSLKQQPITGGKKETKILFEEADGVWINMQRKDRPKECKKIEMKVAISYEGWKTVGKNRRELVNKLACIGFEKTEEFYKKKEKMIEREYNVDEIDMRILNGDGAGWIKNGLVDTVNYQLDPFHKYQVAVRKVRNIEQRKTIISLLRENKIEKALEYIDAVANSLEGADDKTVEKLRDLYTYYDNNREGLIPYQDRKLDLPKPPEGIEYFNLGTMEANIEQIISHRMKKKKASWSKQGAMNLGEILALKACKRLNQTIKNMSRVVLPEKQTNEIITILSAAKTPIIDGKGKDGNIHKGAIPFRNTAITNGTQAIKKIFDYVGFSNLCYR